jgi:hypothetical protein
MLDLEFKLKPSKNYLFLLALLFFLSLLIFLCLPLALSIKLGGLPLLFVYGMHIFWNVGLLRGKQAITKLIYQGEKGWSVLINDKKDIKQKKDIKEKNGRLVSVCLQGDSLVTGAVSVLRFKREKQLIVQGHDADHDSDRGCAKFSTANFFPLSCVVFKDSLEPGQYHQLLVMIKMG